MGTDNSKRRSLLFPFLSKEKEKEKQPVPKFEVVNRKKRPTKPTVSTVPAVPAVAVKSSTPVRQKVSKPASRQAQGVVPSSHTVPLALALPKHRISTIGDNNNNNNYNTFNHHNHHNLNGNRSISLSQDDIPSNTLNVDSNVPPVPDYNSNFFAPPVTIKGRSVSLTAKDVPKRKPPPKIFAGPIVEDKLPKQYAAEKKTQTNNDQSSTADSFGYYERISLVSSDNTEKPQIVIDDYQESKEHSAPDIVTNKSTFHPVSTQFGSFSKQPQQTDQVRQNEDSPRKTTAVSHTRSQIESEGNSELGAAKQQSLHSLESINSSLLPLHAESVSPIQQDQREETLVQNDPAQDVEKVVDEESYTLRTPQDEKEPIYEQGISSIPGNFPSSSEPTYRKTRDFFGSNDQLDELEEPEGHSFERESFDSESSFPMFEQPLKNNKDLSSLSNSEFFDAKESQNTSADSLTKSGPEEDTLNTQEGTDVSDNAKKNATNKLGTRGIDDEGETGFDIQPLFFHRKTASTVSEANIYSRQKTEPTHGKQLSLSDDILRDIESFKTDMGLLSLNVEPDEVSPVSPLQIQQTENASVAQKSSHPLSTVEDGDSLFQDSSDESKLSSHTPVDENRINSHSNDKYDYEDEFPNFEQNSDSSSIRPEINYQPTKSDNSTNGNHGSDAEQSQNFLYPSRAKIPRSPSLHDLPQEIAYQFDDISVQPPPYSESKDFFVSEHSINNLSINDPSLNESSINDRVSYNSYDQKTDPDFKRNSINQTVSDDEDDNNNKYIDKTKRTFHVVNTGDYSDDDDDDYGSSYAGSFDADGVENLNANYSVVHQNKTQDHYIDTAKISPNDGNVEDEVLSFKARSPLESDFDFGGSPQPMRISTNSDSASSTRRSIPESSGETQLLENSSSRQAFDFESSEYQNFVKKAQLISPPTPVPVPLYDRRNEVVAPVAYSSYNGHTRRPPPQTDLPITTRAARSLSTSNPVANVFNSVPSSPQDSLQESQLDASHVPEISAYVEFLRSREGTSNSNASSVTWGLPVGISEGYHSKSAGSKAPFKRTVHASRNDLKHGKIKPRLLASEVDDNEPMELISRQSLETSHSRGSSIGSTAQLLMSPQKSVGDKDTNNAFISRSGTLLENKASQVARTGSVMSTVKPVKNMTLFIANPDIDEDD